MTHHFITLIIASIFKPIAIAFFFKVCIYSNMLGPNLVLCKLRKSIKNFNQYPKYIITKFTKPIYQSYTKT